MYLLIKLISFFFFYRRLYRRILQQRWTVELNHQLVIKKSYSRKLWKSIVNVRQNQVRNHVHYFWTWTLKRIWFRLFLDFNLVKYIFIFFHLVDLWACCALAYWVYCPDATHIFESLMHIYLILIILFIRRQTFFFFIYFIFLFFLLLLFFFFFSLF